MITFDGVPPTLVVLYSLLITVVSVYLFRKFLLQDDSYKARRSDADALPPPKSSRSAKEFATNLFSKKAPLYLLDVSREMDTPPVFELPIPLPSTKMYTITDSRVARAILDDPTSVKTGLAYTFFDDMTCGRSFFTQEGPRFKHVRKSTMAAFAPQNIKRISETIDRIVDEWIEKRLEPLYVRPNKPIDFAKEMTYITIDVISQAAFDYRLTREEKDALKTQLAISEIEFAQRSARSPLRRLPLIGWLFSGVREARMAAKKTNEFCRHVMETYRERNESNPHLVVDLIVNDDQYASDYERACDMVIYFIAGFDTTAYTLSWALLELARCPEEQMKLRKALQQCSSEEEQRNCPELKRVARETMRLHPAAALGSMRTAPHDVSVPGTKMIIPKNNWCFLPYFLIHRNQHVYTDPDSFVPSRWENPSDEQLKAFLPFASGRRNCQGQALANTELHLVLAKLCSRYELILEDEGKPEYFLTWKPVGSLVKVKKITTT